MIMPTRANTTVNRTVPNQSTQSNDTITRRLIAAYNAEIETLANYLACAASIDGIRAELVRDELLSDVTTELGHAQKLAARVRVLGGTVPGSQSLRWEQDYLQPPQDSRDLRHVIEGVIRAEEQAIELYQAIIQECEGVDYATQDLAIAILADEQEHRRQFAGFLKEFDSDE
jgi:bacterioferritin